MVKQTIMEGLNQVHHGDFMDNRIPNNSVDLIIADPPYFEIKGEFDFIWSSFEDYLKDVERWAIECKRILKVSGSLFWYGDRKNIAYSQVILDKFFDFQNHIYWQKAEKSMTERYDTLRSFYTVGFERVLFYTQDKHNLTECVTHIRDYIRAEIEQAKGKVVLKDVNRVLGTATNGGGVASACLSLNKSEPAMITEEHYNKIQSWAAPHMAKSYQELRLEYEELRENYENTRRPFDNYKDLTDHWRFTQGNANQFDHDTVKSEEMTRYMIRCCSRPGDTVFVPFSGSGTECAMAQFEGRNFIGWDLKKKNVDLANSRVNKAKQQYKLL